MIPIVFDGWLLYVQRVSYIENMLLTLITCGMLLYQRALDGRHAGSLARFALAGAVLGFAVVFKYTGVYVVVAVLLVWLIYRHDHLRAPDVAERRADRRGRVPDGRDQGVRRARPRLVGAGNDGSGPPRPRPPVLRRYPHVPRQGPAPAGRPSTRCSSRSFLVAMAAFTVGLRRLWRCYRARDWAPVRGNALLFAWMAAGVVIFGSPHCGTRSTSR